MIEIQIELTNREANDLMSIGNTIEAMQGDMIFHLRKSGIPEGIQVVPAKVPNAYHINISEEATIELARHSFISYELRDFKVGLYRKEDF